MTQAMRFVACHYVQSMDDHLFLCAEDGDVGCTASILKATPFHDPQAAQEAILDHLDGAGVIFTCWQPVDSGDG